MSTLEQGQAAVASLKALREHMRDRMDSRPRRNRRTVLEALETRVTVGVDGLLEVSIGIPQGGGRLCPADPRPEGGRTQAFIATAPEDPHALAFGGPSRLLSDAGLADARLTGKHHQPALAGYGVVHGCRKLDHCTMAANEDTA